MVVLIPLPTQERVRSPGALGWKEAEAYHPFVFPSPLLPGSNGASASRMRAKLAGAGADLPNPRSGVEKGASKAR